MTLAQQALSKLVSPPEGKKNPDPDHIECLWN